MVMIGIRQKLILGFGGLLVVVGIIGVMTMAQISELGKAVDVILRENYRSVIACQDMKESLERLDSGFLSLLGGRDAEGRHYVEENLPKFRAALSVELGNITVPGEGEKAEQVQALFERYEEALSAAISSSSSLETRHAVYDSTLLPLFQEIKTTAQAILEMNQANMIKANDRARQQAATAHRQMLAAIFFCVAIAILWTLWARRWILEPVRRLMDASAEIRRGNLDLVLTSDSRDEIGQLAESFNEMTAVLREARKHEQINLLRTQKATEEVFKALPAAIALLNLDGRVQISTETANRHFGLKPGVDIRDLRLDWLPPLIQRALKERRIVELDAKGGYIQQFIENREYFFQPMAVPIPTEPEVREPTGTALILKDVTQIYAQQELKGGAVSTVSHQLKTPLTSLRMSIHLLLEEKVGALTEQQAELLMGAREDSERLVNILDNLLDLNRMESGKAHLTLESVLPRALARDALEPYLAEAKEKGVSLVNDVPEELSEVMADKVRIQHAFANLLANALRFTAPGGTITIGAKPGPGSVQFSVQDTGEGIPAEHVGRVFEQFYRVPGQSETSGVGLGLAIVKEIVQAHDGEVGVESETGKGSLFYFTLPAKKGPPPVQTDSFR
jgi:two-component system, NtrC family, sensor histidine kinase KinB